MIAVALSGGTDSAAGAVLLKEQGLPLVGLTMRFSGSNPSARSIEKAASLCDHLEIPYHVLDFSDDFECIRKYFTGEYLSGNTPNPCAMCNRRIKFSAFLKAAEDLGADTVATGHYVKKGVSGGRYFLSRAKEKNSQEYFMALVGQDALARSLFPLADTSREEAEALLAGAGIAVEPGKSSQDICFVPGGDYAAYIREKTGYVAVPGDILDLEGRVIGTHQGAINYTIGQRRGLGMGFGRRVYVLGIDVAKNTVTIGDRSQWPFRGFVLEDVNYMKISGLERPITARVKVRYRQEARSALIKPLEGGLLFVEFDDLFAPGQLGVVYDDTDAILCAGIIRNEVMLDPGISG